MHLSELSSPMRRIWRPAAGLLTAIALAAIAQPAQPPSLMRENGKLVAVFYGSVPATPRLHVNSAGPVTVEGGVSKDFNYSVRVILNARTEAEARRIMRSYNVRAGQ